MKTITEEMRFEFYAWHLCEQVDAMAEDYWNANTEVQRRRIVHQFIEFTFAIREPQFIGVFRQRFQLATGVRV